MRFINSSFTDAGFNLAAEEYLLKQGTEEYSCFGKVLRP